jgi:hypothetical protein
MVAAATTLDFIMLGVRAGGAQGRTKLPGPALPGPSACWSPTRMPRPLGSRTELAISDHVMCSLFTIASPLIGRPCSGSSIIPPDGAEALTRYTPGYQRRVCLTKYREAACTLGMNQRSRITVLHTHIQAFRGNFNKCRVSI